RVVGRAVERIDDPAMAGGAGARAAFFGEDGVIGEAVPDAVDDQRFGLTVHLRHDIARAALVADLAEGAEALEQEGAGAPGRVDGYLEKGIGHVSCSVAYARLDSGVALDDSGRAATLHPDQGAPCASS